MTARQQLGRQVQRAAAGATPPTAALHMISRPVLLSPSPIAGPSRLGPLIFRYASTCAQAQSYDAQSYSSDGVQERHLPVFDPLAGARKIMSQPNQHSLETALDDIHPLAFQDEYEWSHRTLMRLLTYHHSEDASGLLTLLPVVRGHVRRVSSHEQAGSVTELYIQRLAEWRAVAAVPAVVQAWMDKLDAIEDEEDLRVATRYAARCRAYTANIIMALENFNHIGEDRLDPLSPVIVDRIHLLIGRLLIHNTRYSEGGAILPQSVRLIAFDPDILTPQWRATLLEHMPHLALSPSEWHACMLSASREGRQDLAHEYYTAKYKRMEAVKGWNEQDAVGRGTMRVDPTDDSTGQADAMESPRHKSSREQMDEIDRLIGMRSGKLRQRLLTKLRPYLVPPSEHDGQPPAVSAITPYAWSTFATHCAQRPAVTAQNLLDLASTLPIITPHTVTPIIKGLVDRRYYEDALSLWEEMAAMHTSPDRVADSQLCVDRAALAAATAACVEAKSLDTAVELVDNWANQSIALVSQEHRIQLDAQNLNILLDACVKHRRPGLAFRLFTAARPRWGVWPDGISLALVTDAARFALRLDETPTVQARLRAIAHEIGFRSAEVDNETTSHEVWQIERERRIQEGDKLAQGPVSVLLDSTEDERKGVKWHDLARQLVREVVLSNTPALANVSSPLDNRGTLASLRTVLHPSDPSTDTTYSHLHCPSTRARYTHITLNQSVFQSYITLLGYFHRPKEVPTALTWMRHLNIQPNWRTMNSAMATVCDTEGPRRPIRHWTEVSEEAVSEERVRLVRDEDVLRRWLQSWVTGPVPTEHDVADFIKTIKTSGGRMSA